jgi:hypothetical protein
MPEMNYPVIYFLLGKSMDSVHDAVNQVHAIAVHWSMEYIKI